MMRRVVTLLFALLALDAHAERFAIRARVFDGTSWLPGTTLVVVSGDRIESVGSTDVGGAPILDIPGAMLTPGFVDCDSSLGIAGRRDERQEASSADLRLADAFEPDEGESEAFRRSGVTLAWLAPGPSSVVGARGALVQPSAKGPARVLDADHGLTGSLTDAASQYDRAPTSPAEQAELIARVLESTPETGPRRVRFDDAGSARLAGGLMQETGGLAVGLPSDDAALAQATMCLSGLGPASSPEQLRVAASLAAEHELVLGSGGQPAGPRALRWAAAALVARGADPDEMLTNLTSRPAVHADAGARGRVEDGFAADLVLWTGDPLSPASRPLRVWVSGETVHAE